MVPRQDLQNRKNWIDVLRAIAMILVMTGHIVENKNFFIITSPVKIPLFFAITGYVFNYRSGNIKDFFLNLLRTLVIPLICFTVLLFPFKCFAAYMGWINHTMHDVLVSFASGDEFWYLPCLIIAEIIFFFVQKITSKKSIHYILMLLLSIAGFVMAKYGILRLFNFNTALCAQLFLLIGYFYKCNEEHINKLKHYGWIAALSLYGVLLFVSYKYYPNAAIDIHNNRYYSYLINIPMIVLGNFALFSLFSKIRFPRGPITFIGRNTLVYYVMHEYCFGILTVAIRKLKWDVANPWIILVVLLITAAVCGGIAAILRRYTPFLIGAKRKKKEVINEI